MKDYEAVLNNRVELQYSYIGDKGIAYREECVTTQNYLLGESPLLTKHVRVRSRKRKQITLRFYNYSEVAVEAIIYAQSNLAWIYHVKVNKRCYSQQELKNGIHLGKVLPHTYSEVSYSLKRSLEAQHKKGRDKTFVLFRPYRKERYGYRWHKVFCSTEVV